MADWAHETAGHRGKAATLEWARARGLPITLQMIVQAQEIGGYIDKSDPWSSNSYLNLLASYSRVSNSTDWWICGTISFSEESSYPYVGVPWTLEELKQYNNTGFGWYREEGKPQSLDRLHIINRPQEGAICISSHNNGANATKTGYSNCTSAWVKGYGNEQHWAMTVKDSSPMVRVI
ncbi:Hypothetical predicted protein, partial [Pelobates cultripes]